MVPHADPYQVDGSNDYPFVPSKEEHVRLNRQSSALNDLMFGNMSIAPVEAPRKILAIGCGTGIQARLLAEKYPNATVIGIDPSPVPEINTFPSNVKFILGCFEEIAGKHELLQYSTFDLIYQRMLIMVIRDWSGHIEQAKALLRPNGWFEAQETDFYSVYNAEGQLISQDWRWTGVVQRDLSDRNMNFMIGVKLPKICESCGLVDARLEIFPVPYRPGGKERPETESVDNYVQWAFPTVWRVMLTRSARPEYGESADELWQEAQETVMDGPIGTHSTLAVAVARKPVE